MTDIANVTFSSKKFKTPVDFMNLREHMLTNFS